MRNYHRVPNLGLGRGIHGECNGTPLQYSCLENPMDGGPGGLQSMGFRRVWHDWATSLSLFTFMHWRRKWQPTPLFLPGESQGRGSLVGCRLWGHTVRHDWSDLAAAAAAAVKEKMGNTDMACWIPKILFSFDLTVLVTLQSGTSIGLLVIIIKSLAIDSQCVRYESVI